MKGPRPSEEFLQKVRRIAMFLELGEPMAGPRNPLPIATDKTARKARKENILTDDQKVDLWASNCYLCGQSPAFGIDRVDASSAYTLENTRRMHVTSFVLGDSANLEQEQHHLALRAEAALLSQTLDQTRSHVHDWEAHGHQLRNSLQGQAWSLTDAASHCSSLASSLAAVSDAVQAQQRMLDKMGMQAHRGGDSPMPPEVARQLQDMQASLSEVATAVKALGAAQGAKEQPPQARKSGGHRPTTARVPVTGRYSRGELMSFR
ncbi:uncharacterized protein HaLaN_09490 [Haematococcus lacustris]|uniref:Uncharacterized protein n=1 Tax=Haematococcus lacustris TaxID=44745 RepID=A0A699YTU0_HAELA|nr:uncharacterized protein HaLaN_09490 [Haematococcus lacustris]